MASAGRGRGRGLRLLSFSVEAVGIGRGDALPPSILQPTPPFPPLEQKPLPLAGGEEVEYMLALKQELRGAMRSLPCFITPTAPHADVERYSDKYHSNDTAQSFTDWRPDWRRLPKELRLHTRKPRPRAAAPAVGRRAEGAAREVLLTLETLEKKEARDSAEEEDGEQKKQQEEEEADGEEEYDEEEFEEETDYIMSYFDNGEDFGGDSDDNMDEAVY